MDIREMKYIIELYKTRHMTQAAMNLHISQPALYKSIKKVETDLDTVLFYKHGGDLLPTDTGRIVIENALQILKIESQMEDSITAVKDLKQGNVHIGFTSIVGTLYLPELIVEFQRKYPGIILQMSEEGGTRLAQMVENGDLDMAIVLRPVHSDTLNEIPIIRDQIAVCVPETHPWFEKNSVTIKDFENIPFITFNEDFNVYTQVMEQFRAQHIKPLCTFTGADGQFIYKYAFHAKQIAVMPRPMLELYKQSDPVKIIPFSPSFPWELCLIFPKNRFLSSASKLLITFIQEYLLTNFY